jgi:capsular exopolysaccharide synthesis family protein
MTDQKSRITLLAIIASLAAAIGLALLLDRVDKRLRYPDQITDELGLDILGAVPSIGVSKNGATDLETATQVVEAFRTVRLGLAHALNGPRPLMLTISSPNLGDGKSLVSSNLALSFAEGGYRTLLIDGDIRRGGLHRMFGIERRPGLVDCLMGNAGLDDVVHPANHANLSVIPGGARRQRGPELLASRALTDLLAQLKPAYDAIIIDSPPLGAGIDPFALGVATGSMMLVVRPGETDRKLAMAKLTLLDRLPVKLVGAVLNAFKSSREYRHYSYDYGYTSEVEDDHALPSGV